MASMADVSDACKSCSKQFDDIKSAIRCCECQEFFHASCQHLVNLRGFHLRRSTWKCSDCTGKITSGSKPDCKRYRSDNDDIVEVDRSLFENLLSMVSDLSASVDDMKIQLSSVQEENRKLVELVSSTLKVTTNISSIEGSTFASVAKTNRYRVNTRSTAKTDITNTCATTPFVFGKSSSNPNISVTIDSEKGAANSAATELEKIQEQTGGDSPLLDREQFQKVQKRRKKITKPLLIGNRESTKETQCDNPQVSSEPPAQKLEGMERRQWVYIGRVKAGVSTETVVEYVKNIWNITDVLCYPLRTGDELSSFKVGVRESHIPSMLDASKWPSKVAVREFVVFPKRNQKSTTGGNFLQTSNLIKDR